MTTLVFFTCLGSRWDLAMVLVSHEQEQREMKEQKGRQWSIVEVALKTSPKEASNPIHTRCRAFCICLRTSPTWEVGRRDLRWTREALSPFLCCCGPRRSWGQEARCHHGAELARLDGSASSGSAWCWSAWRVSSGPSGVPGLQRLSSWLSWDH